MTSRMLKLYGKYCDSNAEIKSRAAQWPPDGPDLTLYIDVADLPMILEWARDQMFRTIEIENV